MEQSEVRRVLIESIENNSFFKILDDFEFKDIRVEESVIVDELVYLHNEAIFDLNKLFLQLKKSDDQYSFYSLMR